MYLKAATELHAYGGIKDLLALHRREVLLGRHGGAIGAISFEHATDDDSLDSQPTYQRFSGIVNELAESLSAFAGMDSDVDSVEPVSAWIMVVEPVLSARLHVAVLIVRKIDVTKAAGGASRQRSVCAKDCELSVGKALDVGTVLGSGDELLLGDIGKAQPLQAGQILGHFGAGRADDELAHAVLITTESGAVGQKGRGRRGGWRAQQSVAT